MDHRTILGEAELVNAFRQDLGEHHLVKRDDIEPSPRSGLVPDDLSYVVGTELDQQPGIMHQTKEWMVRQRSLEYAVGDVNVDNARFIRLRDATAEFLAAHLRLQSPVIGKNDNVLDVPIDTETHDGAMVSGILAILFVVREGGFVAVMSVGDDQRALAEGDRKHLDFGRRIDGPHAMQCCVFVGEPSGWGAVL